MKLKNKMFGIIIFFGQICFAEISISQSDALVAKALCLDKSDYGSYSIKQRQDFLHQAVQNFDNLRHHSTSTSVQKDAQSKWEKNQIYIQKNALEGLSFWDVGTTCPKRLEFPNVNVESTSAGRTEAFSRATQYSDIGLCKGQQGKFSINDRLDFLQAAKQIYDKLKKVKEDLTIQKSAQLKSLDLESTLAQIKSKGLDYWDVSSTCPATNYSRARSGPSLPATNLYPPTAPSKVESAR